MNGLLEMPKPQKELPKRARKTGVKSGFIRVPEDIAKMMSSIAEHELNGWKTQAAILDDPSCPLREWILPLFDKVVEEKRKQSEAFKKLQKKPS